ncbi:unnamed protein product, partial [Heterotrigona itama]
MLAALPLKAYRHPARIRPPEIAGELLPALWASLDAYLAIVRATDAKWSARRTGTGRFPQGRKKLEDSTERMKGWFDAFRIDGGPTLYSYSNRTPVTGDVPLVIVFVIFGTIFTAFLVIYPGIRKEV